MPKLLRLVYSHSNTLNSDDEFFITLAQQRLLTLNYLQYGGKQRYNNIMLDAKKIVLYHEMRSLLSRQGLDL